jgi:undecaprenyl phosphate-alpha-L-ara4FN deformylase
LLDQDIETEELKPQLAERWEISADKLTFTFWLRHDVKWQDGVPSAGERWTQEQMQLACNRFREVFGEQPLVHGAAGWQMNVHAYRRTQSLGFMYASDTRGTHPFLPVIRGEIVACPQYPTTLPTLDELIGLDGVTEANAADALLERTRQPADHVFTMHAELEGMKLSRILDQLLEGWKAQGYSLVAMRDLVAGTEPKGDGASLAALGP